MSNVWTSILYFFDKEFMKESEQVEMKTIKWIMFAKN